MPPSAFIPVAEGSSLILDLGDWVLAAAARQLRHWTQQGAVPAAFYLSVNISPRQFQQQDFPERVQRIFEGAGADLRRLVLELTEGVLVRDSAEAAGKMRVLRQAGVRFFIDDFGTGYSSLAYLKRLPVDGLKIDQSFVRDLGSDANDAAIVETILVMASRFALQVVAEGVEQPEQLRFLRALDCRCFQGYLFSRPLDAAQFALDWLHPAVQPQA